MAVKTLPTVTIEGDGSISYNFPSGSRTFVNRAAVTEFANELITEQLLENLVIARWPALDPDMNDPNVINGTTLEVNLASALNPVAFGQS